MPRQEILPPLRDEERRAPQEYAPRPYPDRYPFEGAGIIDTYLIRRKARRDANTMTELVPRNEAAAELARSETALIEQWGMRNEAIAKAEDRAHQIAHYRSMQAVEYREQLDAARAAHVVNQKKRDVDLVKIETMLTDARQELEAQLKFGSDLYSLAWKKRLQEAELEIAAKQEMVEQLRRPHKEHEGDEEMIDLLLSHREYLNASGLDTSRVDALLEQRRKR